MYKLFLFMVNAVFLHHVVCFSVPSIKNVNTLRIIMKDVNDPKPMKILAASILSFTLLANPTISIADEVTTNDVTTTVSDESIPDVPLFTKKRSDLQPYSDVNRGFKLLRPFGFNEFDGTGTGYAVKFASLFDVDENVVIGSVPASAGKSSITEFGKVNELGEKFAAKRKGVLKKAEARKTEGIVFYQFEFENPLDLALPRPGPKDKKPTKGIELYALCVAKGRLWSVQATSNDRLFPGHEKTLRAAIDSFIPRL